MKIFLDMVGCRLNQAEIDALAIDLVNRGSEIVTDPSVADTIIVNTCCVTAKASADSRKMIRHYKNNFSAKVVSTGCWVSVDAHQAVEISDQIYLNDQKELIPEFLLQSPADTIVELDRKPKLGHRNRTRGFVKVQDGCNNCCSFCLTTIARGRSISTLPEIVLDRIKQLERMEIKEIILTGVQLGSWGKDLIPKSSLSALLEYLLADSEMPRIRLSSIEPWDIDEGFLSFLSNRRIMPHFHIPLQSGSNSILRAMRRPVTQERFSQVLGLIRDVNPKASITTDVISGFPGETDELFEESFNFIETCNFSGGHVFSFSAMPGTAAFDMNEKVKPATIKARTNRLLTYFQNQQKVYQKQKIGQIDQILFESRRKAFLNNSYSGFSGDYLKVVCDCDESVINQIRTVKITGLDDHGDLLGEIMP